MVNIGDYGASLLDRTITPNEVISTNDWLEGAHSPTFIRQQDSFKTITLVLLVRGGTEQGCIYNVSQIVNAFRGSQELQFEDIPGYTFPAVLEGQPEIERLKPTVQQVTLTFKGDYAMGNEVSLTPDISSGSFTIVVDGTAVAPITFELKPKASEIVQVKVRGLTSTGFTVNNVPAGNTLIVDSEKSRIVLKQRDGTEKNAIDCYNDCWELPALAPGEHTVTLDYTTGYDVTIKYRPRYV